VPQLYAVKPVVDADPIEIQRAVPSVTDAVILGFLENGVEKVTARRNVDTLVCPSPY
jgi:hypothetical protein